MKKYRIYLKEERLIEGVTHSHFEANRSQTDFHPYGIETVIPTLSSFSKIIIPWTNIAMIFEILE